MNARVNSAALIITLIAVTIIIVSGILFNIKTAFILYASIGAFILIYFISLILLKRYFIVPLGQVSELIIKSINNEELKNEIKESGKYSVGNLTQIIKKLIHEKTIEIDNLKQLERMRKEFLGDVAHELRTPVFNVQGYIHTLLDGAINDQEVNRLFLEKAAKHVDILSNLVEDLVTISRIETGELPLNKTDFNIVELVNEVLEVQESAAKEKNIRLTCESEKELYIVNADKPKIMQVLNNLVNNSIKYGKSDGHTQVKIGEDGDEITVSVVDNGIGISEEDQVRIFERFYRVDKSRARNVVSSGLGLAIAKHFIEAHNQKIMVTSRIGIGSIFSFSLQKSTS